MYALVNLFIKLSMLQNA